MRLIASADGANVCGYDTLLTCVSLQPPSSRIPRFALGCACWNCTLRTWPRPLGLDSIAWCVAATHWRATLCCAALFLSMRRGPPARSARSEEHTSELQSHVNLVC